MGNTEGTVTVENKTGFIWTICIKSNQKIHHYYILKGRTECEQKIVKSWTFSSSPEKLDLMLKQGKCTEEYCSAKPELTSEIYTKENPYYIIKMSKDYNFTHFCLCKDGKEMTVSTYPVKGRK